jgi:hypothetical protein
VYSQSNIQYSYFSGLNKNQIKRISDVVIRKFDRSSTGILLCLTMVEFGADGKNPLSQSRNLKFSIFNARDSPLVPEIKENSTDTRKTVMKQLRRIRGKRYLFYSNVQYNKTILLSLRHE